MIHREKKRIHSTKKKRVFGHLSEQNLKGQKAGKQHPGGKTKPQRNVFFPKKKKRKDLGRRSEYKCKQGVRTIIGEEEGGGEELEGQQKNAGLGAKEGGK